MKSPLLSKLTKDFLNKDLDTVHPKERYRMGWGGSILAPHPQSQPSKTEIFKFLLSLKKTLFSTLEEEPISLTGSPQLPLPRALPEATFRPPWYFCRGALENDRRKNPEPIAYLLTETQETARAHPVPGGPLLIRSLCKGKGTLQKNQQGFVFLNVDNYFISSLLPYLKIRGLVRPPYFNLFDIPDGAHIPVIPAREAAFQYLNCVDEIGQEFSFEIEGLYSIEPTSWPEVEQVWFFKLKSSELEAFRRSYFLPSIPGGHAFHIAVAVKPRSTGHIKNPPLPVMRVNSAITAA